MKACHCAAGGGRGLEVGQACEVELVLGEVFDRRLVWAGPKPSRSWRMR